MPIKSSAMADSSRKEEIVDFVEPNGAKEKSNRFV